MLPCVLFEDEHLLVVNKPAGVNTHAPSPYAGEGIYDWLRNREPRWASLAIVHRLDKETSGVMVFTKTREANRALTTQFTARAVKKTYLLLCDRPVPDGEITIRTSLARAGERYVSRPGADAVTRFRKLSPPFPAGVTITESALVSVVRAEPLTGRTHQIRVHAAERHFPILGDSLYGGTSARRVFLHAHSIRFRHPATEKEVAFEAPPEFDGDPRLQLRQAFVDPGSTDCFRILNGAADGHPGWYIDKLGPCVLSQAEQTPDEARRRLLAKLTKALGAKSASHKALRVHLRGTAASEASPKPVVGTSPSGSFTVLENGVRYELSFNEGYSVGLFLDQRDNRLRLLTRWIGPHFTLWPEKEAPTEVLNTFAYTCAFSVCAAKAGARVTSLDLSKNYLDWGRRNFALNGLDSSEHDFIYGDTFDWLRRFARKGRRFDLVLLDPPTFSRSKVSGVFRAEKDYARLVTAAVQVLKPGAALFASSNAAGWAPGAFLAAVREGFGAARRRIRQQHYFPQPPDFPVSRAEPAYLKTVWVATEG